MAKKHLIIFADYGLDDAAATATIFESIKRFSHISIVPVGGNVPARKALENCITLLSFYKPLCRRKVTVVETSHIPQPSAYTADIHGQDGMGDIFPRDPLDSDVKTVRFEEWLSGTDGKELVLSLGPMTMVKPLMEKHPEYVPVIMGGCVHTPPNFNGFEFNQSLDREAFAFCTKGSHAAITLDTCRVPALDMRLREIRGDDVHSRVLQADQRLSVTRGEEGCYVWDDVAAAFLLYPDRFQLTEETDLDGNRLFNATYISDKLYYLPD